MYFGSKVVFQGSHVVFRGSQDVFQGSQVVFRGSQVVFRGSQDLFRGSKVVFRGSQVAFRGSQAVFRGLDPDPVYFLGEAVGPGSDNFLTDESGPASFYLFPRLDPDQLDPYAQPCKFDKTT